MAHPRGAGCRERKSTTFVLGLPRRALWRWTWCCLPPAKSAGAKTVARCGPSARPALPPPPPSTFSEQLHRGLRWQKRAGGMGDTASASLPAVVINGVKLLLARR